MWSIVRVRFLVSLLELLLLLELEFCWLLFIISTEESLDELEEFVHPTNSNAKIIITKTGTSNFFTLITPIIFLKLIKLYIFVYKKLTNLLINKI